MSRNFLKDYITRIVESPSEVDIDYVTDRIYSEIHKDIEMEVKSAMNWWWTRKIKRDLHGLNYTKKDKDIERLKNEIKKFDIEGTRQDISGYYKWKEGDKKTIN